MKIFITGSTGFVGTNLIMYYKNQHELWQHVREENLTQCLEFFQPDIIINCAADIYNAEAMFVPNVLWVQECLEYVKNNPNVRMVQIGSSAEYGPMDRASSETDRINPVNMYQATKGAATLLCQGYARTYDLDISIARPYSVYGPFERPHRLFPRLWRAFKLGEPMKLFDGYHDFIYIDDFVRGIDTLVKTDNKPLGDVVNFGSGEQFSNLEVLHMFKKVTGAKAPVEYIDSMAKSFESNVWVCDTTYAKKKYGFVTEYTLEAGVRKFLENAIYKQENL